MLNINTAEKLFTSTVSFMDYTDETLSEAKNIFAELSAAGVIRPGSAFEDSFWRTTDQYQNIGLYFDFNEVTYRRFYLDIFGMELPAFIDTVKCFIVSLFGRLSLAGIYGTLLDLRHLIRTAPDAHLHEDTAQYFKHIASWEEFVVKLIADPDDDSSISLVEHLDDYSCSSSGAQRALADFDTYFLFDEIIHRYWKEDIPDEERLFYYPVYLWWCLTSIIPQRPREFLLMPRNCLTKKDGKYYLDFRRNRNKGYDKGKTFHYSINEAYSISTYPVTEEAGRLVEHYIEMTDQMKQTELDTLFVTVPHYKKWGINNKKSSRFFTAINFRTVLQYFYEEIITGRYGYRVVYAPEEGKHLADGEICYIHPGDTRHIALINLMQSGGTPHLSMLLAGHTSMDMASHYYSNLMTFIKCKTYRQYRRYLGQNTTYRLSTFQAPLSAKGYGEHGMKLSSGRCASPRYRDHDYTDCLNSCSENGEIGHCPSCIYYMNDTDASAESIYKSNLKADCECLAETVKLVRQHKGYPEEVAEILNRLHGTAASFEEFLMYKKQKEEQENGTSETDRR